MKTKKARNYSEILLLSAILVTVVRYAGAFIASDVGSLAGVADQVMSIGMGFTGLGMGILDVLGTAYLFDAWKRTMPASGKRWPFRFKILTVFIFALFIIGIGILVPFTVSRIRHETMAGLLGGFDWVWALLVVTAPFILVGGIATGQSLGIEQESPASRQNAQTLPTLQPTVARQPKSQGAGSTGRQQKIVEIAASGEKVTVTKLSNQLGVSRDTVYADLAVLEEMGKIHRNGNGIEVRDGYR